jgi:hypothetical protein
MPKLRQKRVTLDPDEYHAEHVGWTESGRQFILREPFIPATDGNAGCEFLAVYLFDPQGNFVEARIDVLGEL